MPKVLICDFCGAPDPRHAIGCDDFIVNEVVPQDDLFIVTGEWLACADCYDLVEREDKEGLKRRAIDAYMTNYPEDHIPYKLIEGAVDAMYAQFWAISRRKRIL